MPTTAPTVRTITAERRNTEHLCSFPTMIARGAVCTNCHRVITKSKGMSPLPTDQPDAWHERYCLDCGGDPKTNGRTTKEQTKREQQQSRSMKRKNADSPDELHDNPQPITLTSEFSQDAPPAGPSTADNDQLMFAFT